MTDLTWHIEKRRLADLIPWDKNPRRISKEHYKRLKKRIIERGFHDVLKLDENDIVLSGNQRLQALLELGRTEANCIIPDRVMSEEEKHKVGLESNISDGETDFDILRNNFDSGVLQDVGYSVADLNSGVNNNEVKETQARAKLNIDFVAPPFSILDTRQGYWQERKTSWISITGNLSQTKEGVLAKDSLMSDINEGSSNFDPVLAEIVFKWFSIPNGKILDPFGGEQTKGVVAGELGFEYHAVEIRKEQCDINSEICNKYNNKVKYYNGDSNNIDKLIKGKDFDLCFTSPPYYDLEIYSDSNSDMSNLQTYEEFMCQYKNIFTKCYDMLSSDRFLVVKIGEVRDKKTGQYRNFVGDNITIFNDIGFKYYNEIIIINCFGTAPQRAGNCMKTRKVVKVHQNLLVFYKGDLKNIKNIYPIIKSAENND
jgi:DNA modification methylase